jgi:hypothetical protein
MWHFVCMCFQTLLARTLVVFALLGLVGTPLIAPVPTIAAPSAVSMSDMADDMPCCPPDAPPMPDCYKGCPLLTVCVSKCFGTSSGAGTPLPSLMVGAIVPPGDDAMPAGLAQPPPARPPQSLA